MDIYAYGDKGPAGIRFPLCTNAKKDMSWLGLLFIREKAPAGLPCTFSWSTIPSGSSVDIFTGSDLCRFPKTSSLGGSHFWNDTAPKPIQLTATGLLSQQSKYRRLVRNCPRWSYVVKAWRNHQMANPSWLASEGQTPGAKMSQFHKICSSKRVLQIRVGPRLTYVYTGGHVQSMFGCRCKSELYPRRTSWKASKHMWRVPQSPRHSMSYSFLRPWFQAVDIPSLLKIIRILPLVAAFYRRGEWSRPGCSNHAITIPRSYMRRR